VIFGFANSAPSCTILVGQPHGRTFWSAVQELTDGGKGILHRSIPPWNCEVQRVVRGQLLHFDQSLCKECVLCS